MEVWCHETATKERRICIRFEAKPPQGLISTLKEHGARYRRAKAGSLPCWYLPRESLAALLEALGEHPLATALSPHLGSNGSAPSSLAPALAPAPSAGLHAAPAVARAPPEASGTEGPRRMPPRAPSPAMALHGARLAAPMPGFAPAPSDASMARASYPQAATVPPEAIEEPEAASEADSAEGPGCVVVRPRKRTRRSARSSPSSDCTACRFEIEQLRLTDRFVECPIPHTPECGF